MKKLRINSKGSNENTLAKMTGWLNYVSLLDQIDFCLPRFDSFKGLLLSIKTWPDEKNQTHLQQYLSSSRLHLSIDELIQDLVEH